MLGTAIVIGSCLLAVACLISLFVFPRWMRKKVDEMADCSDEELPECVHKYLIYRSCAMLSEIRLHFHRDYEILLKILENDDRFKLKEPSSVEDDPGLAVWGI